jgi:hypothetical protein
MAGFDKIEFAQQTRTTAPTTQPKSSSKVPQDFAKSQSSSGTDDLMAKRRKNNGSSKKFRLNRKVTIGLAVFVIICILTAIPAYFTYQSGLKTYRQAQLVNSAIKKQNVELAGQEIEKTKVYLNETQRNLGFLIVYKYVPVLGWYYTDLESMLNAGEHGLDSAKIVTDSLTPYADVLGLKGNDSFAGGSTEDRIKTAVLSMGKITPEIDRIEESISKAQKEIDKVDPNHYPKIIFGNKVNDQLTTLKLTADQTATAVRDAKPLIKTLPSLLGEQEAKRYLVLFQNDKELRATGGFLTAYAIFSIDKGIIKFEKSDDIYPLDDSIRNKPKAPEPILKYLPKVYTLNLRDSNLSPDFLESMKTFEEMYSRSTMKEDVDGIIAIDTHVLVNTVKILDDQIQAGGQTFTTQNDPRCDCPQIIYELENDISRPVNYIKTDRKSIIGDLISAIMVKALSSSPQQYWGPLFQSIIAQTQQKHIMFKLYDEQAQQGIQALNAAGQIRPFEGDYLHINEVNFSGAKVNIFMEQTVDNEYKVEKDGTITKTLTIKYKNPFPPSDCNLERGGLCLNAEYRDWIRIYVPKGSELVDSKGSQVKMTTYEDLGKTVFEGFVTVRPKGVGTLTLTYKLPFKLENGSPLPVLIQKQPGTEGPEYQMIVDGKPVEMFNLTTDKETKLKL